MTVSARGVRRKSGATAAACQQLCWGEFTLYEYQGRWAVKEAAAERRFEGVRGDLEKLALASYFAEVTETLAEEGQPEPETLSQAVLALEQSLLSLESVEEVRFLVDGELADTYGPIDLP